MRTARPSRASRASQPGSRGTSRLPARYAWLACLCGLAAEGDTVRVDLADGQLLATAVGPAVPEEGQFPVPATTPCTFTITLAGVSGAVPLRAGAFTIRDEQGRVHHPRVAGRDGRPAPATASAGHAVTVTLKTVLPTGAGELQWAPQGGTPVVSWDFDVEID